MTAPRQCLAGATYLVTRRCDQGRCYLRPDKLTTMILGYLVARTAARTGVKVHAYCAMSNHLHLVVTDPLAVLPRFLQDIDGLAARAINARYGRSGYVWEEGTFNQLLLDSPEDVLDRCAYVLANPVTAGLVRRARQWPGLWSAPEQIGEAQVFERPGHFFKKTGQTPKQASLVLEVPPGCGSVAEFRARLAAELKAREEKVGRERQSFLGVARVLRQRVLGGPERPKPIRGLKPRFAARSHHRRMELARRLKEFLVDYQEALSAWRRGVRGVVFPAGTYLMRVQHGVACAGAGQPAG